MFQVLSCSCVINLYRQSRDGAQVAYVEEKGPECLYPRHQTNEPVTAELLLEAQELPQRSEAVPRMTWGS